MVDGFGRRPTSLYDRGLRVRQREPADGTNDGTKTYTWNVRDQLLSMTGASFQYDAYGRRHRRVVGGTTRDFVYDGLNLVQEKQYATVKANVITGLGLDEVFTRVEGSTSRHLLAEALGSTLALTDPAGAVQTQYTYAPFGTTTASGPTDTNPFKFTGREDDGTGLYYYRARYYAPILHRFTREDPLLQNQCLWSASGMQTRLVSGQRGPALPHGYTYTENNPVLFADPSGLDRPPSPPCTTRCQATCTGGATYCAFTTLYFPVCELLCMGTAAVITGGVGVLPCTVICAGYTVVEVWQCLDEARNCMQRCVSECPKF